MLVGSIAIEYINPILLAPQTKWFFYYPYIKVELGISGGIIIFSIPCAKITVYPSIIPSNYYS